MGGSWPARREIGKHLDAREDWMRGREVDVGCAAGWEMGERGGDGCANRWERAGLLDVFLCGRGLWYAAGQEMWGLWCWAGERQGGDGCADRWERAGLLGALLGGKGGLCWAG